MTIDTLNTLQEELLLLHKTQPAILQECGIVVTHDTITGLGAESFVKLRSKLPNGALRSIIKKLLFIDTYGRPKSL